MARVIQYNSIQRLLDRIEGRNKKPFYLKCSERPDGTFTFEQVEFLTVEEFAEFLHVDRRTVYKWIERAGQTGLKYYRVPESRNYLFSLSETLDWLESSRGLVS